MIVLLSGPSGSGKTTIATLLADRYYWVRVAEDDEWSIRFGRNRNHFGSDEHRRKRAEIHAALIPRICAADQLGRNVVLEATVHEAPPEAFLEYGALFAGAGLTWLLRVLLPRVEVAAARDANRPSWHIGANRVATLHAKFTRTHFPADCFLDNSDENPQQTCVQVLMSVGVPPNPAVNRSASGGRAPPPAGAPGYLTR